MSHIQQSYVALSSCSKMSEMRYFISKTEYT